MPAEDTSRAERPARLCPLPLPLPAQGHTGAPLLEKPRRRWAEEQLLLVEGVWGQGARKSRVRGIPHGAAALKGLWGTQKETRAGVRGLEVGGAGVWCQGRAQPPAFPGRAGHPGPWEGAWAGAGREGLTV